MVSINVHPFFIVIIILLSVAISVMCFRRPEVLILFLGRRIKDTNHNDIRTKSQELIWLVRHNSPQWKTIHPELATLIQGIGYVSLIISILLSVGLLLSIFVAD